MGTQEEHTVPFSWEESRQTGLLEYSLQIQAAAATEQLLATLNSILIMHLILFFLKNVLLVIIFIGEEFYTG